MITLSAEAMSVLTRSYRYHVAVESWLGGELLADGIPVAAGDEDTDRTLRVPERVTFTVPRLDRGVSWSPVTDRHPLAANGQRLRVLLGVGLDGLRVEWFQRGWFLITESRTEGDTVTVTAAGLLALIDEARLVSPFQPTGDLSSTLRALVEPALTVVIDPAVTILDRTVPAGANYDEDRLGAVLEVLDAWPADASVSADGYLHVVSATPPATPVLALSDGAGGTLVRSSGASTREGAATAVVARGTAPDGGQVQGVAYDTSGGPKSYFGPFNPLPVPAFFESPLLSTAGQAQAAADTVLARLRQATARQFEVEMVPHPALQVGDVVSITNRDVTDLPCTVETLRLPYTAGGGAQTLTVRALP